MIITHLPPNGILSKIKTEFNTMSDFRLNIDDVSNCLEFVPSTKDGLFCTVCDEHKQCHSKLLLTV